MENRRLFKLIWRGWFAFVSVVFTPILLFALLFMPSDSNVPLYAIFIVPIVAALQGAMLAAAILVGLKIWPIKS